MCHCPTYKPLIDLFAHKIKWTDQPNIQGFPFQSITEISLFLPWDPSSSQSKLETWEEISAINLCVYTCWTGGW